MVIKAIKRDGSEVDFKKIKIVNAIHKANNEVLNVNDKKTLKNDEINTIVDRLYNRYLKRNRAIAVEEIQDDIETEIMKIGCYEVAKHYIRYRYNRELARQSKATDNTILSLIDLNNEDIKQENSNKNPTIIPTQRDYIAGEVSKDISSRLLIPPDIVEADKQGIIHFHDKDYFVNKMYNCCLINLEDMLQNGTVISGTRIDKPHSFNTACTIATQIIAQVASCQYGLKMTAVL